MGNLATAQVNTAQLQGCSRELDLSRRLTYEQYQEHIKGVSPDTLKELPQDLLSISTVSFYEKMDVSFNCIAAIPSEFSVYLPHLNYIDFSHNKITFLPESFGYLFHLKTLIISNNKLRELPSSFCWLMRLEKADLSHNYLHCLPDNFGNMECLQSLNVSNNELEALPLSLGKSRTLKLLLAIFNKCKSPPQQICNQGSDSILAFLRNQNPKELEKKVPSQNEFPRVRGGVLDSSPSNPHTARAHYIQTQTYNLSNSLRTPLRPPIDATKLPPDELVDRVIGCLYGAAMADAIGLCTEFMIPDECNFYYEQAELSYGKMIKDRHRTKWVRGDWTDSSDQMILLLDNILHWAGVIDELEFAKSLMNWCRYGFLELGDTASRGVRGVLAKVVADSEFLKDPHGAAKRVWETYESPSNGAVMRTAILGLIRFDDLNEVATNAVRICKSTHFDPRCVASCVAISTVVALMMQGKHDLDTNTSLEELIEVARKKGNSYLEEPSHQKDYNHYFNSKTAEDIECCEPRLTDYTFKPMAAGIVALRSMRDFKSAITDIAMQGGHTTCNVAVAGALLGCKVGYSHLPREWLHGLLPRQVAWLNTKINCLLDMMALP